MRIRHHRPLRRLAAVAVISASCAVSLPAVSEAQTPAATITWPKLTYTGTITMYAGEYTPPIPGVKPAPGTVPDNALNLAAAEFESHYPGIKITFVPSSAETGTDTWFTAEAAAGTMPDLDTIQGTYVNRDVPKGLFTNLLPYFAKSDPFLGTGATWGSTLNEGANEMDMTPGTTPGTIGLYVVDGDWAGAVWFYNKNLFKKAGISTPPTSWEQYIADSQKLNADGISAGATAAPDVYNWLTKVFMENYLGVSRMRTMMGITGNQSSTVTSPENSYFFSHYNDWLNPSKNPELTAWWPAAKEELQTWDKQNMDVSENVGAPALYSPTALFLGGKVATVYVPGYSMIALHAALPKSQQFPMGVFVINNLKGTSPYASNLVTWQDVGGPFAGFQFGVAAHEADSTMTPAKLQAAMAWLQLISSPKWDATIVDTLSASFPLVKGAQPAPLLKPIVDATLSQPFWGLSECDNMGGNSFAAIDGLFLEYVDGYVSLSKAQSEYNSDCTQFTNDFNTQNALLMRNFTAQENKKLGISS
jgi:ABC-type glycerol-3-phosphate transport system substrate-binding protein